MDCKHGLPKTIPHGSRPTKFRDTHNKTANMKPVLSSDKRQQWHLRSRHYEIQSPYIEVPENGLSVASVAAVQAVPVESLAARIVHTIISQSSSCDFWYCLR